MLVLSRRLNERIILPTLGTAFQIVGIRNDAARVGIQAPTDVAVLREEVFTRLDAEERARLLAPEAVPAERLREQVRTLHEKLHTTAERLEALRARLGAVDPGAAEEVQRLIRDLQEESSSGMVQFQ